MPGISKDEKGGQPMFGEDYCKVCKDLGWILDGTLHGTEPVDLYLIECPIPDCQWSGRPLDSAPAPAPRYFRQHLPPARWRPRRASDGDGPFRHRDDQPLCRRYRSGARPEMDG